MRRLPLTLARRLGNAAAAARWIGFAYVVLAFFAVPGGLLALSLGTVCLLVVLLVVSVPYLT
jgi:hypothetical protein